MEKINIAVIGCGRIANKHLESIQHHASDLHLTAVCDPHKERLSRTMIEYSVDGYDNIRDLLQYSNAHIVSLCTPSGLHAAQTIQVASSLRHVICEKPMATTWDDGKRMLNACDNAGVRLFVVKQNRYNPAIQRLKHAIDAGRFGKIYFAQINVFWTRPQAYYDQASWRGTWEFDGGALMNQASHYFDLAYWLLGPIESVQAMIGTLARKIEVEDTGVVNFKWRHGALGNMSVTMMAYPNNFEGSITILGENGLVRVGGVAVNSIEHWEFKDQHPEDHAVRECIQTSTGCVYGSGHVAYYRNVIDVLRGNAEPIVPSRDALKSLEVMVAAYRSAREHRTLSLPLEI